LSYVISNLSEIFDPLIFDQLVLGFCDHHDPAKLRFGNLGFVMTEKTMPC
jgi:hypothetical protein